MLTVEARQEPSPGSLAGPLRLWSRRHTLRNGYYYHWGNGWILYPSLILTIPSPYPCPCAFTVSIFLFPRSVIDSLRGFLHQISSLTNTLTYTTLQINSVWQMLLSSLCRWGKWISKRKMIHFSHMVAKPASETTSARLQSHRCWNSFIPKCNGAPAMSRSCVRLEINVA